MWRVYLCHSLLWHTVSLAALPRTPGRRAWHKQWNLPQRNPLFLLQRRRNNPTHPCAGPE